VTGAHLIYIPIVVIFGIVVGFFLGGRAARDAIALEQKKAERRAAAKAEREQRISDGRKDAPKETPKETPKEGPSPG
jgi:hypothetical protein